MRKGQKATPEQRKRMSEGKKLQWKNMEWTEEMSAKRSIIATRVNTGRKLSKSSRQKTANSLRDRKRPDISERMPKILTGKTGPLARNWKGGISPYGTNWNSIKLKVKRRDGYKCKSRQCTGRSKIITVHHKDENKKNNKMNNLITLCKSCHSKLHPKGFVANRRNE